MDCRARQALLSMGFPRLEYCSGLPFPSPGDLDYPGMAAASIASCSLHQEHWQADSLPLCYQRSPPNKKNRLNLMTSYMCGIKEKEEIGIWFLEIENTVAGAGGSKEIKSSFSLL